MYIQAEDIVLGRKIYVLANADSEILYGIQLNEFVMIVKSLQHYIDWVNSDYNLDIPYSIWWDWDEAWRDIHDIFQKTMVILNA